MKNMFLEKINKNFKKRKIYLFLSIFFLSFFLITKSTYSFLWEDLWIDLYDSVEDWLVELEDKLYEYEITWWWENLWDEVNRVLFKNDVWACIKDSINLDDFKKIASWDIYLIYTHLKDECKWNSWDSAYIKLITDIYEQIAEIDLKYTEVSEEKSKEIYKISRIWLYSDWDVNNSWFDLIDDINQINKIIFTTKIDYIWETNYDISSEIKDFLEGGKNKNNNSEKLADELINEINFENITNIEDIINNSNNSNQNTYACYDNINNDNLIDINDLIDDDNIIWWSNNNSNNSYINTPNYDPLPNWWNKEDTWYKKLNDNSSFPCNSFFCITVNFIKYEHKVFWWQETFSIQKLLERSNEHLSKFAWSSLVPAKMTTNIFELWLTDLNLPELFHIWFQVSSKAPPILNLNTIKEDKNEWEFAAKNLIEKYYASYWLEYKKKNSLVKFNQEEEILKSIIDATLLENSQAAANIEDYRRELELTKKEFEYISNDIDKKFLYTDMENFVDQLIEMDWFVKEINDYCYRSYTIIKQMLKIPSRK